jgi:hypothetical protein
MNMLMSLTLATSLLGLNGPAKLNDASLDRGLGLAQVSLLESGLDRSLLLGGTLPGTLGELKLTSLDRGLDLVQGSLLLEDGLLNQNLKGNLLGTLGELKLTGLLKTSLNLPLLA